MKRTDGKFRSDSKIAKCFDEVVRLYRAGWSTQRLGEKFGIDASNIYRNLISRGIVIRNHSEASNISFELGISKRKCGPEASGWNGGSSKHTEGYILIRRAGHPRTDCRGYVPEHILVAEKTIGRELRPNEVAHHKNRIRDDNRPENLEVMTIIEHQRLHGREGGYAKAANSLAENQL